jgi:hypothetical protein
MARRRCPYSAVLAPWGGAKTNMLSASLGARFHSGKYAIYWGEAGSFFSVMISLGAMVSLRRRSADYPRGGRITKLLRIPIMTALTSMGVMFCLVGRADVGVKLADQAFPTGEVPLRRLQKLHRMSRKVLPALVRFPPWVGHAAPRRIPARQDPTYLPRLVSRYNPTES